MATTRGKLFNVKNGSAAAGANFCPCFCSFGYAFTTIKMAEAKAITGHVLKI